MKKCILTGTPGSGKTSLIRALEDRGYAVVDEVITDLYQSHLTNALLVNGGPPD